VAFLSLNGWAIPTVEFSRNTLRVGDRGRVHGGEWMAYDRYTKREWTARTSPMPADDANALAHMLRGLGHHWSFDDETLTSSNSYNIDAGGTYSVMVGTAADGAEVVNGAANGKGIQVDPASVNVLSANQASVETDTTGFTAIDGAALTQDATHYWTGTKSLKVVTSGAVNSIAGGVETDGITTGIAYYCLASAYVKATAAISVTIDMYDADAVQAAGGSVYSLEAGKWHRIRVGPWLRAATTDLRVRVTESVADSNVTFYVDGLQLETLSTATIDWPHTAWMAGGTSRASPDVIAFDDATFFDQFTQDFTINLFASVPSTTFTSQTMDLLFAQDSPAWNETLRMRVQTGVLYAGYRSGGSGVSTLQRALGTDWDDGGSAVTGGTIKMCTIVRRTKPLADGYKMALYFDGVLAQGRSNTGPDATQFDSFWLGNNGQIGGGGQQHGGIIDELTMCPYPWSANMIAAVAANSKFGPIPKLTATGDFLDTGSSLDVFAAEISINHEPAVQSNAWDNASRSVSFKLIEP